MLPGRPLDSARPSLGSVAPVSGALRSSLPPRPPKSTSPTSASRPYPPSRMPARQNKYFLPGDGIRREVITADICRYLGNDALVKPGQYEGRDGYWVTAYRALTSDMIADLKADSLRWAAESAQVDPRNIAAVPYRDSQTHEYRQHHGPSSSTQQHLGQVLNGQSGPMDPRVAPGSGPSYYDHSLHPTAPGSYMPSGQYPPPGGYSGMQEYSNSNQDYLYGPGANFSSASQPRTGAYPPYPGSAQVEGSSYPPGHDGHSYHQSSSGTSGMSRGGPAPPPQQPQQQQQQQPPPRGEPYGRGY